MLDNRLRTIALILVATSGFAWGQAGTPQNQLRVTVRSGQDAQNDAQKRDEVPLAVRVEDANGNPAAGARVEFVAPSNGPSGSFADGSRMISVTTDQAGDAEVRGFRPDNVAGSFEITVTAVYQGATGTAQIRQTNVSSGGSKKKLIAILAGVGGGAVAVAALAGGGEPPTPTTTPDQPANLVVSKTSSASTLVRGGTGSFTLTVTNNGGATNGTTVTVSDPLPSGLTPTSASGTGWTCPIASQTVTCTRTDVLNAAASYPAITIQVNVAANAGASLTNIATVSGGGDSTAADGSVTIATAAPVDLTISKTASAPTFLRGGTGTFTLTVTNNGGATNGTTVTVTDSLPTGLTPTSASGNGWTCTLAVSCTRTDVLNPTASYPAITIQVNVAANAGASLTNTATVSGGGDSTATNGSVTIGTTDVPDLTISKTASAPTFVRGGTGSFTLTVTNNGAATNGTTVTVSDSLPTGLTPTSASGTGWTCTLAVSCTRTDVLNPTASYPAITIQVNVAANAAASLTNTASVVGGGDSTAATGPVTIATAPPPDLTISKTASAPTFVRGGTGSFTLTITNNGGATNGTTVTVSDSLPTGLTPTSASGTGWTCTLAVSCTRTDVLNPTSSYPAITVQVNVATNAGASLTNTATVSGGGDSTAANGSVTIATAVGPILSISKTASAPILMRGGTGSFTLTVTNGGTGPTNATTVTVSDSLPTGLTPTSAAGTGWTCTVAVTCTRTDVLNAGGSYPAITIQASVAANAGASLTNTASVSGGGDSTAANGSVTIGTAAGPDLTITKTASAPILMRGGTGSFTLSVTNNGSATSGTVTVSDSLPTGLTPTSASGTGWTCTLAVSCTRSDVLAATASYPAITIQVTVAANAGASLTNNASVVGGGDSTASTGSVTIGTAAGPDLTISKTASAPTFLRGGTGSFTLTVTNNGSATNGTVVTVSDSLPAGLTPASATGTGWTCTLAVSCTRTDVLTATASYPAISVTVNVAANAGASLTNTASVIGGGDSTASTGSVTVNTSTSLSSSSLSVTKEIENPIVAPGDVVGFRLDLTNSAEVPLNAVTLNDTLPTGFAYKAGSARIRIISGSGEETEVRNVEPNSGGGLIFPIGLLEAGSRVTLVYSSTVTSNAQPGEFQSQAVGLASSTLAGRINSAPARVRVVVTAGAFSLTQVMLGRVFEDSNKNGRFDDGERGVANVRVLTSSGQAASTDSYGQYSLPTLAPGSVLVAVDPATLPPGLELPANETRLGGAGQLLRTPLEGGAILRQNFALVRTAKPPEPEGLPTTTFGSSNTRSSSEATKLEVIAERPTMAAGGHDKQLIRIRALNGFGRPAADTSIVVTTLTGSIIAANKSSDRFACESLFSLEELPERARELILETEGGEAVACLTSDIVPNTTRVSANVAANQEVSATADVRFEAARRSPLFIGVGEVGIGLSRAGTNATANASRIDGLVSLFYQGSVSKNDLLTVAIRSKEAVNGATGSNGLFEFDSTQRVYPVMGDSSTHQELAQSTGRVYARYDRGKSYLMYGDLHGDSTVERRSGLMEFNRNVTGMRFQIQSDDENAWLQGQVARPKTAYTRDVFTALMGSTIRLSRSQIVRGSETITLEVRDRRNPERTISRETLVRNEDYTLDPLSGVLYMIRPISLFDPALNLVQLVSTYEYEGPNADSAMYLGRGSYSIDSLGLRFGGSMLSQNESGGNFAVGGLELEKRLPNGGRFLAEAPMSRGYVPTAYDGASGTSAGSCCEMGQARNGTAIRAEFEQPLDFRATTLRGRFARTDEGFFNPYGSIAVPGQQSSAILLETRASESGRLSFGFEKEANRNSAVHNQRRTFSAKLSQTLRDNLLAEVGIDRREFEDHKSNQQIDSHLISAGLQWKPLPRLEASVRREQNVGEADPTYPDQTLVGAKFEMTDTSRLFATQRFSSAAIVPISGAETSGLLSPTSTRETTIGVESRLRQNTSLTTRYRMDSGVNGTDSFAVVGVLTRVPVRPGLSIDWSLDNALHLAGSGRGYLGGSFGFSQLIDDKLRISARYELRHREIVEHGFTAGVVGRLTESTSALARYRISNFGAGTATSRLNDGQLALSVRPRKSDRVALLFSYDFGAVRPTMLTPGQTHQGRTDRVSADGLVDLGHGLNFYSRAAKSLVPGFSEGRRHATFFQGRLQQSLFRRFDIAGEARWIRESANVPGALVTGAEFGTWLTRDFRIGLGYSAQGFANPGALLNSTAARGGLYLVISSRLSSIFDLMGESSKKKSVTATDSASK